MNYYFIYFSQDLSNWDVSSATNFNGMFDYFFGNKPLNSVQGLNNWDVSSATNFSSMFKGYDVFNNDLSNWNVVSATNMNSMFQNAFAFDSNLSGWNIINVTNFSNFLKGVTLSTSNYEAILVGWESTLQNTYPNGIGYTATININFGGSQYTSGSAADTAKTSLINNFGWTISDGGAI